MADSGAQENALKWLDRETAALPADGNFHALALEALIRGTDCTWAVAADTSDGFSILASCCKDGERPYEPNATDGKPPFQSDPANQYWFATDISADQGVEFKSCRGHVLHDEAGEAIGYLLALDRQAKSDDTATAMFFRLIAARISARLSLEHAARKQVRADLNTPQSRALFDSSPIAVSITSAADGAILFVNRWWSETYGRPAEELIGTRMSDYYPAPEIRDDLLQRLQSEGFVRNEETQVKRADDGALIWILLSLYPIEFDGQKAVLAWAHDINERKVAETELRVNEQSLQNFADASADWFWETDAENRFTYISDGFERATGFTPESQYGRDRLRLLRPAASTPNDFEVLRKLEAREAVRDHTYRYSIQGRDPMWIRSSALPIHDGHGNFAGYRGSTANITAEIEARQHLQSIADRYLSAIDSMSDGVALWDADDRLVVCNQRFRELSGDTGNIIRSGVIFEETVRATAAAGSFAASGDTLEAEIQERLAAHGNLPSEMEVRRLHRILNIREQSTADGGIISIVIDMTAQRQFEEQLHQAQKMEAVGQLTGGLAHDFNNLLAVISGNLELLDSRAKGDVNLTRFIERGLAAAERGAQLTNRLLTFSRRQPVVAQTTTLDRLIVGMQDLVQRTLGGTIQIKTRTGTSPWPCRVDVSQLENSILNLAINARDAMPDGGSLTIETENLDLTDASAAQRQNLAPGCYVTLSVSDTGTGMTPDVLERAFDPFFTTKETEKGSGLGLSMVYGFVQQSGGQIRINSAVDEGTKIVIYLPRSADDAADGLQSATSPELKLGNGEIILVVEDDAEVMEIAITMLTELNYQVLHVDQSQDAIALIRKTPDLKLLLSDVVLPGDLNGKVLAETARQIRPDLRVLFMSGYARDAFAPDGRLDPADELLQKPFRKSDLARAVARALST
ncbi:MAG: PAS domain S-box protein [Rhodospirillaceae bacterium]|nr:PAS domain S-box protein [Rhodospirillaceae bacterium]